MKKMQLGEKKLKIGLLLMSTILILFILEIGFKLFGPEYHKFNNIASEYYSNPRDYYDLLYYDNNDLVYGLVYPADENEYRLPDNTNLKVNITEIGGKKKLILGLGDSRTFGKGVRYNDIYLKQLEARLDDYRTVNRGSIGADVYRVVEIFQKEIKKSNYSLVIYGFGIDDFGLNGYEPYGPNFLDQNNGGYTYNVWRKRCALFNYIMHVIEKQTISKRTIVAYLGAYNNEETKDKLQKINEMDKICEEQGCKFILVIFPLLVDLNENHPFKQIHNKLNTFCNNNNILVLDLFFYFSEYSAEELWAAPTDQHPNEIAHNITADAIYEFLIINKLLE